MSVRAVVTTPATDFVETEPERIATSARQTKPRVTDPILLADSARVGQCICTGSDDQSTVYSRR